MSLSPYLHHHLAVVLEDIGGGGEVQHPIEDQLTVASQLVPLLLENRYLCLFLILN